MGRFNICLYLFLNYIYKIRLDFNEKFIKLNL